MSAARESYLKIKMLSDHFVTLTSVQTIESKITAVGAQIFVNESIDLTEKNNSKKRVEEVCMQFDCQ